MLQYTQTVKFNYNSHGFHFILPRWIESERKTFGKRSRWWCVGSRSTNREGETKCKRNSKCIYILVEKWGFTVTVACQAPICLNPVRRTAPLRCSLQRNVQTQGIQWGTAHMKVSNCKRLIAIFVIICHWKYFWSHIDILCCIEGTLAKSQLPTVLSFYSFHL